MRHPKTPGCDPVRRLHATQRLVTGTRRMRARSRDTRDLCDELAGTPTQQMHARALVQQTAEIKWKSTSWRRFEASGCTLLAREETCAPEKLRIGSHCMPAPGPQRARSAPRMHAHPSSRASRGARRSIARNAQGCRQHAGHAGSASWLLLHLFTVTRGLPAPGCRSRPTTN